MHKNESGLHRHSVGLVGVRGYSGLELARVLLGHPCADLQGCYISSDMEADDYLPADEAKRLKLKPMAELETDASGLHTVFLATPAEVSLELAPKLLAAGTNVIDLSGAFRLKAGGRETQLANYMRWYGLVHPQPELLETATYGLFPWAKVNGKGGKGQLIANPGCYATSILLGLIPLLKASLVNIDSIVVDAKSGTSGAGRKATENLLFTEVEGECLPYRVGRHQHMPEIQQTLAALTGVKVDLALATHLIPVRRGIISSIYARLNAGSDAKAVANAYGRAFEGYPLVQVEELAQAEGRGNQFALSLRRVVGTPAARIVFRVEEERLYVFSLIDNLMKGAATQAVENFNRLTGLAPETGLMASKGVL